MDTPNKALKIYNPITQMKDKEALLPPGWRSLGQRHHTSVRLLSSQLRMKEEVPLKRFEGGV